MYYTVNMRKWKYSLNEKTLAYFAISKLSTIGTPFLGVVNYPSVEGTGESGVIVYP